MKHGLVATAKLVALWFALIAGTLIGGILFPPPPMAPTTDGPLSTGAALFLVNLLFAIILALLAARMTGPYWRRTLLLFVLVFAIETILSEIETWYFAGFVALPPGLLATVAGMNAVKSLAGALAAASLWRDAGPAPGLPSGLGWKLPAIALLYIPVYFGFGQLIAWQSAAVRAYYGQGLDIARGPLALLQLGRGAIWACLALIIAASVRETARARAVLTGLAFSMLMAPPLLYPNPFMPWAVRQAHLAEIGLSNLFFGLVAGLILARGMDRARRPVLA